MNHTHRDKVVFTEDVFVREFTHDHRFLIAAHVHDYAWEGKSFNITNHFPMRYGRSTMTETHSKRV